MRGGPGKWTVLTVLFVVLVLCDQWTKFLAVERLTHTFREHGEVTLSQKLDGFYTHRFLTPNRDPYVVWAPAWQMIYAENPGAAWGLFRGLSPRARNAFFIIVSMAAVAVILLYYRKLRDDQRYYQVALSLLLAGAVGNFVDRLARQYVIDFIDWYAGTLHWPTFNVADSLIVVGVALLLVYRGPRKASPASRRPTAEPARRRGA